ncbi:hypothetical protein [Desulfobacula sp.]|uniref:hypothetical protein n=1 Tax=Desulfobacula sp. TaxID=2593537 RepID=UPI002611536C|nr:hypothetical protein [Desulfobacula sp.]
MPASHKAYADAMPAMIYVHIDPFQDAFFLPGNSAQWTNANKMHGTILQKMLFRGH